MSTSRPLALSALLAAALPALAAAQQPATPPTNQIARDTTNRQPLLGSYEFVQGRQLTITLEKDTGNERVLPKVN